MRKELITGLFTATLLVGGTPLMGGCNDRTVSEQKSEKVSSDGTKKTEEKTVTAKDNGTVTTETKKSVDHGP